MSERQDATAAERGGDMDNVFKGMMIILMAYVTLMALSVTYKLITETWRIDAMRLSISDIVDSYFDPERPPLNSDARKDLWDAKSHAWGGRILAFTDSGSLTIFADRVPASVCRDLIEGSFAGVRVSQVWVNDEIVGVIDVDPRVARAKCTNDSDITWVFKSWR